MQVGRALAAEELCSVSGALFFSMPPPASFWTCKSNGRGGRLPLSPVLFLELPGALFYFRKLLVGVGWGLGVWKGRCDLTCIFLSLGGSCH